MPIVNGVRVEQELLIALLGLLLWMGWQQHRQWLKRWSKQQQERLPRHWHAKSAADCPHCQAGLQLTVGRAVGRVTPYGEHKSRRGRRKQIQTEGLACPNPGCEYCGVTSAACHALVGYGTRGQHQAIQRLRCQACHTVFSCRRGTPLYYLKTDEAQVEMVLWFLAEGVDSSVMVRYTGHAEATIARWLARAGDHSQRWHDQRLRGLVVALVQMDELYVRIRTVLQGRWLWVAIDPLSKVILSVHLGRRRAEDAYALVHDTHARLAPSCVPAFTTDGLKAYFYALTAHFGHWFRPPGARKDHWQVDEQLLYGQLVKRREHRTVTFTWMRMLWGKRHDLTAVLRAHGLSPCIQTAFIERVNLTIRQGIALLTRKTWSLPQSEVSLLRHVQWWRLYYHWVRPHQSLQRQTPAMVLGLADHVWTVAELLHTPLLHTA
jgi:transposase-like protein